MRADTPRETARFGEMMVSLLRIGGVLLVDELHGL
jgi:hypothetical protein